MDFSYRVLEKGFTNSMEHVVGETGIVTQIQVYVGAGV